MYKKFLAVVILFCSLSYISAQAIGTVSIAEELTVIQTEYFDIIFPEQCKITAKNLAIHADSMYLKALEFSSITDYSFKDRIPVVLSDRTDVLNGYFTVIPYNRIVLYDSVATDNLAVFDETILDVFYHELIHEITIGTRLSDSTFLNTMGALITQLEMPTSMSEGVAVFAESLTGKGRLNDAFSTHIIRQAKIEDCFPDWSEITGAYNLYTDNSLPYIFGGAFMHYVYNTYGIEKIIEFWNNSSKLNFSGYTSSFKKIFGISIDDAWYNFENSIPTPTLKGESRIILDENHLYSNLTANSNGIAWLDSYSGEVFFLDNNSQNKDFLFVTDLTERLVLSKNNKYICVSGSSGGKNSKNLTRLYDLKTKRLVFSKKDLRDSTYISIPLANILVGVKTEGQKSRLEFYSINDESESPLRAIDFENGEIIFNPVDCGNGVIASLLYSFGEWKLFFYDFVNDIQKIYAVEYLGKAVNRIDSLHVCEDLLVMSVAKDKNSQPVLATVDLKKIDEDYITLKLYNIQRSGGVFSPVLRIENGNEEFVHILRYYDSRKIGAFSLFEDRSEAVLFYREQGTKKYGNFVSSQAISDIGSFSSKTYNPFSYYNNGLFVPFIGAVTLHAIHDKAIAPVSLGASIFFLDPAEQFLFLAGGGYDFAKKNVNIASSLSFTDMYFHLNLDTNFSTSFDAIDIFAQQLQFGVSNHIFSDFNTVGISNKFRWFYLPVSEDSLYSGFTIDNGTSVYFQNLRKTAESPHSYLGALVLAQLQLEKYFGPDNNKTNQTMIGTILKSELWLPQMLPFENPSRFTVNLPFSVYFVKYFTVGVDWEAGGEIILFSYEIQKSDPYGYLFFNTITLDTGVIYTSYIHNAFDISVYGSLYLTAGINTGFFVDTPTDIGIGFDWNPMQKGLDSIKLQFKFGLNL